MAFKLIKNWRTYWLYSGANRTAALCSFIVGAFIQWHMAMFAFLAFLPMPLPLVGGGVILVVLIAGPTSIARVIAQDKLAEKVENKQDSAEAE